MFHFRLDLFGGGTRRSAATHHISARLSTDEKSEPAIRCSAVQSGAVNFGAAAHKQRVTVSAGQVVRCTGVVYSISVQAKTIRNMDPWSRFWDTLLATNFCQAMS